MTITIKYKLSTLYVAINMCSIIIYSVSGKLGFSHETNFVVNDSVVQEFHYNTPNIIKLRSAVRLPTSTAIDSFQGGITYEGTLLLE